MRAVTFYNPEVLHSFYAAFAQRERGLKANHGTVIDVNLAIVGKLPSDVLFMAE